MLQDYHRQTTIKPFAPILKDRSSKRWDNEVSLPTNLSLLSISNSSKHSEDDVNEISIDQHSRDRDSSSSRESISPSVNKSEEHKIKNVDLDSYIFNKHLNGIPSTISNLVESQYDQSVNELFDESKSTYQWENEDYNPRSIRPPPFSQYIKHVRDSRAKFQATQRRSARIPVRTTKAEQLKLARQRSTSGKDSNLPYLRSSTAVSQHKSSVRHSARTSMNSRSHLRTIQNNNNNSLQQVNSARSCRQALNSNGTLLLSSMLIKQMRQDIKSNRVPAYSKPLNSALLHEQPHPPFTYQYKMKRIRHWLEKLVPTEYIEYNDCASNETVIGTNFNDKLDDECDLLSDEKRSNNIERTFIEAHRALPLFKSEIHRKIRQHNLLLTRLELDLYVI